jgi:hypothetical protein
VRWQTSTSALLVEHVYGRRSSTSPNRLPLRVADIGRDRRGSAVATEFDDSRQPRPRMHDIPRWLTMTLRLVHAVGLGLGGNTEEEWAGARTSAPGIWSFRWRDQFSVSD